MPTAADAAPLDPANAHPTSTASVAMGASATNPLRTRSSSCRMVLLPRKLVADRRRCVAEEPDVDQVDRGEIPGESADGEEAGPRADEVVEQGAEPAPDAYPGHERA